MFSLFERVKPFFKRVYSMVRLGYLKKPPQDTQAMPPNQEQAAEEVSNQSNYHAMIKNPESKKPRSWKRLLKKTAMYLLIAGLVTGLAGMLSFTILMAWISRDLPKPNTLMTRDIPQTTKIYDKTGEVLLYEIHGEEKRTLVEIGEIPDYMKQATIALEDRAFYEHHGINWKRIIMAVYVDIIERRKAQGASTLTQQLVKNAILTSEKSWTRKLKEMLLALQIERTFSKDQIIQMYLNEIPYGSMVYGVQSAADAYFGKSAKDLTLDEAALLASIPQAPDRYNPYGAGVSGDNREALVVRQHYALDAMVRDGYITAEQAEEAKKIDTLAKLKPQTVSNIKAPHFVMYVKQKLIDTFGQKEVEQGGLKVITSLDWNMQQAAEEEIVKGVEKRGESHKFTNAALVAMDPKTGQIEAMVGSKDFWKKEIDGQVNVAISPRQPGSSFKPIVYAAGFIKGYTSETVLWDVPTAFKTEVGPYKPNNYSGTFNGPLTVRKALQGSLNIPAVKMMYLVGVGRVLDFAEQLGYTTFGERDRFGLAVVLGGGEVKLLEHANAFAAFANQGTQYQASSILKVTDNQGAVLYEWEKGEGKQAVPREAALTITNVLSDNSARAYVFGTNNSLTLPDRQVAAKTGTTNNWRDAWTMGYTPNLVAGVWVGNSNGDYMSSQADGSIVAAPIWQAFMKRATKDLPIEKFEPAPPISSDKAVLNGKSFKKDVKIDKVSGKLATDLTPPDLIEEKSFFEGHSILWYLDKDDPMGPAPVNPAADPQFSAWEQGVQDWIKKEQWNVTSTAPTEYDDVHTDVNKPTISITSPTDNQALYSRDFDLMLAANATRIIKRMTVSIDQTQIADVRYQTSGIRLHIPNSIAKGYHDLTVVVYDDVMNRATAHVTINLNAEPATVKLNITSLAAGTSIRLADFPVSIITDINDLEGVNKIDLKMNSNGQEKLVGSIISPTSYTNEIQWSSIPELGQVTLFPVAHRQDGSVILGDPVTVIINP